MAHNKVQLIGNLTRDIELRATPNGTYVAKTGIAINRKFKDTEETTFIDLTAWAKSAETLQKYAKKGSSIFIEGRLKLDTWEDKHTGQKRNKLSVVIENFQLLDKKTNNSQNWDNAKPPHQVTAGMTPPNDNWQAPSLGEPPF